MHADSNRQVQREQDEKRGLIITGLSLRALWPGPRVILAQQLDQVLNAILSMAGRQDFVLTGKVEDLRRRCSSWWLSLESILSKNSAADR
jgi:hypothetical protein